MADETQALKKANERLLAEVAERRRAEEALRASEERARLVIDTAYDAYVGMDDRGTITDWNRQAEAVFGWARGEAVGRNLAETIIPARLRAVHERGLARFLATGEGPLLNQRIEVMALRRDGREFPAELTITPLRLADGYLFSAFVHDVTERKRAEDAMRDARRAAEAANKAKGDFLANMSHEVRTPMNGILGMTELALETNLTVQQREYLRMVQASAESLLAVINDILDFSKIEAGKLELERAPFDLRESLGDTIKVLALRAAQKGLELAYHVAPDVPETLVGDAGRLRQVVVNLVGNAVKFTERGEVCVRVKCGEAKSEIPNPKSEGNRKSEIENPKPHGDPVARVRDSEAAGPPGLEFPVSELASFPSDFGFGISDFLVLHFEVTDTGIGIPVDKQRQIFEAFGQADVSTTRRYGGTGLGLTIASRLVELIGGRIGVASEPGRGSTFTFTARFGRGEARSPRPAAAGCLRGMPVLVVDDNATNRRILEETLRQWDMRPTAVEGGAAALAALSEAAAAGRPFPLVLLDSMMPELDGLGVADRIRREPALAAAVLVLLSSAGRTDDAAELERLGIAACLTKPVKQSELLDAVVAVLGRDAAGPKPRVAPPAARAAGSGLRVLLAEDNRVNQMVARILLQKQGHEVTVVATGREVLAELTERPYDLVLMDVQMPEMDGFETTAAVRAREAGGARYTPGGERLAVVAMTAHAMKGDRERCLAAGMDGYVAKPIDPGALARAVEAVRPAGAGGAPDPARVPEAEAVVHRSAVLQAVGGKAGRLPKLVEVFRGESGQLLAELRAALCANDAARLRRAAHSLKGAVAVFGFAPAIEAAQRLEAIGQSGNMADAARALAAAEGEVKRLQPALARLANPAP
jgi:PAS domain S-box-containing protein